MTARLLISVLNLPASIRAILALLVCGAIVLFVATPIWLLWGEVSIRSQTIQDKRIELGRYNAIVNRYTPAPNQVEIDVAPRLFLDGTDDGLIQADLQTRINAYVQQPQVIVQSSGPATSFEQDGIRYVGINLALSGTNEGIHKTLLNIESSTPLLLVKSARFSSLVTGGGLSPEIEPKINLQLAVFGSKDPLSSQDQIPSDKP